MEAALEPLDPSDHDRQILGLLLQGASDAEVAEALHVSERTVGRRVARLLQDLGARSRLQAGYLLGLEVAKDDAREAPRSPTRGPGPSALSA
jgi:DNA-binding NarL/FixJ family response regulator